MPASGALLVFRTGEDRHARVGWAYRCAPHHVHMGIPQRTSHISLETASVRVDIGLRTCVYTDAISTDEPL